MCLNNSTKVWLRRTAPFFRSDLFWPRHLLELFLCLLVVYYYYYCCYNNNNNKSESKAEKTIAF